MNDYNERLKYSEDVASVFKIVRDVVENKFNRRRDDLVLEFDPLLPLPVKAIHKTDSNIIVLNKSIIGVVSSLANTKLELNSYIFWVLLHEYLHSLGIRGESDVASLARDIIEEFLGVKQPAALIAHKGLSYFGLRGRIFSAFLTISYLLRRKQIHRIVVMIASKG